MKNLKTILWIVVALCAAYGMIEYFNMMSNAQSAPQQAAGAAMAMAVAVIPYVFVRAISKIEITKKRDKE